MRRERPNKTIWIDLDNSPHVPFFIPIIGELEKRGHSVILTARDTFQVVGLADYYKLSYARVGRHYGANKLLKIHWYDLAKCSTSRCGPQHKPDCRSLTALDLLCCYLLVLGIPTILMFDYEHATMIPIHQA